MGFEGKRQDLSRGTIPRGQQASSNVVCLFRRSKCTSVWWDEFDGICVHVRSVIPSTNVNVNVVLLFGFFVHFVRAFFFRVTNECGVAYIYAAANSIR